MPFSIWVEKNLSLEQNIVLHLGGNKIYQEWILVVLPVWSYINLIKILKILFLLITGMTFFPVILLISAISDKNIVKVAIITRSEYIKKDLF